MCICISIYNSIYQFLSLPPQPPQKKPSDRLVIYLFLHLFISLLSVPRPSFITHPLTHMLDPAARRSACMYVLLICTISHFFPQARNVSRWSISSLSLIQFNISIYQSSRIKLSINLLAYPIPSHLAKPTSSFHHVWSIEIVRLRDETNAWSVFGIVLCYDGLIVDSRR